MKLVEQPREQDGEVDWHYLQEGDYFFWRRELWIALEDPCHDSIRCWNFSRGCEEPISDFEDRYPDHMTCPDKPVLVEVTEVRYMRNIE